MKFQVVDRPVELAVAYKKYRPLIKAIKDLQENEAIKVVNDSVKNRNAFRSSVWTIASKLGIKVSTNVLNGSMYITRK